MNINKITLNTSFGMPKRNRFVEADYARVYAGAFRKNPDLVVDTEIKISDIERLHEEKYGCCDKGNASWSDLEQAGLSPRFEQMKLRELDTTSRSTLRSLSGSVQDILKKQTAAERELGVNSNTLSYLRSQADYIKHLRKMNGLDNND